MSGSKRESFRDRQKSHKKGHHEVPQSQLNWHGAAFCSWLWLCVPTVSTLFIRDLGQGTGHSEVGARHVSLWLVGLHCRVGKGTTSWSAESLKAYFNFGHKSIFESEAFWQPTSFTAINKHLWQYLYAHLNAWKDIHSVNIRCHLDYITFHIDLSLYFHYKLNSVAEQFYTKLYSVTI